MAKAFVLERRNLLPILRFHSMQIAVDGKAHS